MWWRVATGPRIASLKIFHYRDGMHPRYSTNSGRERNLAGGPRGATIYGPKEDGTYVVELGRSGDGDLCPEHRGSNNPALSGADALRTVRAAAARETRNATTQKMSSAEAGERLSDYRFHFFGQWLVMTHAGKAWNEQV